MLIFKVDICTMFIYKVIVPNMRNFTSERSKPGQFISQTGAVHENREFHGGPGPRAGGGVKLPLRHWPNNGPALGQTWLPHHRFWSG